MPKLLNINNYHYRRGGSDVVYLEHAAMFEDMGWENAFFSMHHPKNFQTEWSKYFVDEIEFGHEYSLWQKLIMASKVIYSLEAQKKLKLLIEDFAPKLAHLHCIYHHLSPSILPVLKSHGIKTVMTAHDLKIACPAYKMLNEEGICEKCKDGTVLNVVKHKCVRGSPSASAIVALESGLQRFMETYKRNLDKVVAPSRFFLEKFVEWGWSRDQLVYIPNYSDISRFDAHFEPGNYFLYFGRLAPEKGVATLIKAATKAGTPLKIAGTGPIENELKALAEDLNAEVDFLGYQTGKALEDLVKYARAVVLPSEWYENAPMSVLESYGMGTPVIGANIGGIPEMVLHGESGWTFTSQDVEELADVLQKVKHLDNPKIANMGKEGRAFVQKNFSRERYVVSMLNLYSQLGVPGV
jgi:glycosyltransferase involved in cell wall biosynthesis